MDKKIHIHKGDGDCIAKKTNCYYFGRNAYILTIKTDLNDIIEASTLELSTKIPQGTYKGISTETLNEQNK